MSSYHFIDRKDPRIEVMFEGIKNMERLLKNMDESPKSIFRGEIFLTDEELSKILKISRRTLQEYRSSGLLPYYLLQGKALYKESEIHAILEKGYRKCREDQKWI